jgi:hypothetical protein
VKSGSDLLCPYSFFATQPTSTCNYQFRSKESYKKLDYPTSLS